MPKPLSIWTMTKAPPSVLKNDSYRKVIWCGINWWIQKNAFPTINMIIANDINTHANGRGLWWNANINTRATGADWVRKRLVKKRKEPPNKTLILASSKMTDKIKPALARLYCFNSSCMLTKKILPHQPDSEKFRGSPSQSHCSPHFPEKYWDSLKRRIPHLNITET